MSINSSDFSGHKHGADLAQCFILSLKLFVTQVMLPIMLKVVYSKHSALSDANVFILSEGPSMP